MRSNAKVLKFPLAGIARDIDYRKAYIPAEESVFATAHALNVRGTDTFSRRKRGGSRPGLKQVTIGDGAIVVNQHARYATTGLALTPVVASAHYRARNCAAVGTMWLMSAMGAPTDWTFNGDKEDPSRAFGGNIAEAGKAGEDITALMAIRDEWLFIATAHSLWCMTGDPVVGQLKCVSETVGCISQDAWCFDGTALWVLSNQGLYRIAIGDLPMKASSKIPEEMLGLTSALLVYDAEENAIHIFSQRVSSSSTENSDWFYDIEMKSFWKESFQAVHRPSEAGLTMLDGVEVLVYKGSDSNWRRFADTQTKDDNEAINSEVAIGPIRCADRDDIDGFIAEVDATLAAGSSDVTLKIYTGHSPEEAVDKIGTTADSEYTIGAGWNNVIRPRKRGAWAVMVLSGTGRWGYESMTAISRSAGRLR